MNFTRFLPYGLLIAALFSQTTLAMTPGASLWLYYQCQGPAIEGIQSKSTITGNAGLIRNADGGFRVIQREETSYPCPASPDRFYETSDGYFVRQQGQQQSCQPSYRELEWNGPQVDRLKEAIQDLRARVMREHPGCDPRFVASQEVSNW